jgi:glutathione S-transferase
VQIATEVLPVEELHGQQHVESTRTSSPSPPKSLVLSLGSDFHISMSNSMIRTIASIAPASELLGRNEFEAAQVDSWLSFLWHSMELPLHVWEDLSALPYSGEVKTEREAVESQLKSAMATIEAHLTTKDQSLQKSYFVGESITLADICLAVALKYNGSALMFLADLNSTMYSWLAKIEGECRLYKLA